MLIEPAGGPIWDRTTPYNRKSSLDAAYQVPVPECTLAHDHVALPEVACATGCITGIMLVSGLQKSGSGRARGGMQAAFHAPAPLRKGQML